MVISHRLGLQVGSAISHRLCLEVGSAISAHIPSSRTQLYGHAQCRGGWLLWSGCLCPYPNSYVETLTPKVKVLGGRAFGRCLGHEGGVLINGISALIKATPERSLAPLTMCIYKEKWPSEQGRGLSRDTEPASAWILDYMAFKTVRNKFLLLRSYPVYDNFL